MDLRLLLSVSALGSLASAQVAYELAEPVDRLSASYPPGPLEPAGAVVPTASLVLSPGTLLCGPSMPDDVLAGAVAIDESPPERLVYTDGSTLFVEPHPHYGATGASTCMGGLAQGVPGSRVTAMAIDPATDTLYLSDGTSLNDFTFPATGPAGTPVSLGFLVANEELTGMDYDDSTGSLWGTDSVGNIYNFKTNGAAIGPQPVVASLGMSGVIFTGLAIDDAAFPGAVPPPACAMHPGGFRILALATDTGTGQAMLFDALNQAQVRAGASAPGTTPRGLALAADVQRRFGTTSGPSPVPVINRVSPYTVPNQGAGIAIGGAPNSFVYLLGEPDCPSATPMQFGNFLYHLGMSPIVVGPVQIPVSGEVVIPSAPLPAGIAYGLQAFDFQGRLSDAIWLRLSL